MCTLLLQEVHDSLVTVEYEAERLFNSERNVIDGDTQNRDRLYARAQEVRVTGYVLLMF